MPPGMALVPGTRLGPYEIAGPIGEGGMGQVYRATDTNLGRHVAIKVLPDGFSRDAERLARFEREARTLASLNHVNIAIVHGFERSDGVPALVMELVEGPTLHDRVAHGSIPLAETLSIARQVADALEAAHEQGIIHRDLKPANIKVRPDGRVKVLDFGLAKLVETDRTRETRGSAQLAESPTITSPAMQTIVGVLLGTAAYMSPEQAKGDEADRTSDVWAFGCVLYEMLTGRVAFQGATVSETIASVLKDEPDWRRLPTDTPENIRRLLRRCLNKDRKRRIQHIGDARLELEEPSVASPHTVAPSRRERIAWTTAVTALAIVATVGAWRALRTPPAAPEVRLELNTPPTSDPISFAISPDAQKIVYVATSDGRSRLWLRYLGGVAAQVLAGTDGATFPFWSPDSRSIGFFADSSLKRIDINGGAIQTLAKTPITRGGTWNQNGTIVFAPQAIGPLLRVQEIGSEPSMASRVKPQQGSHRFPQFLPDGQHFLYYATGSAAVRGVYVGALDGSEPTRLMDADTAAAYSPSGHLLFIRQDTLFAQDFDPRRLSLAGDPFPVAQRVAQSGLGRPNLGAFSTSADGPLVYRTGSAGRRQLVWFDRAGGEIAKAGGPEDAYGPSLSPDGMRVAIARTVNGNTDVWSLDLERGILTRLTSDSSIDSYPVWSPDGSRVAYQSNRAGYTDLYQKSVNSTAGEELLLGSVGSKLPYDWSSDGRFLVYRDIDEKTSWDLWILPMDGHSKPWPLVRTEFDERDAEFSKDGKWIAYQSNESNRFEIYVQPFPDSGTRQQVSTNGGTQVRWRSDGKELFYIAVDGRLMAVPIQVSSDGKRIIAGTPVPLFATQSGDAVQTIYRPQYMVSANGQRFLMSTLTDEGASPLTVILNWKPKP
jgi:serine/threonine protein kinase